MHVERAEKSTEEPITHLDYTPLSKTDAFALTYKRSRIGKLPWKNSDLGEAAYTRLKAQLGAYSKTSDNGYDILDIILPL